ncbi:unnamed protein product [Leptosia nina]|uniref:Uncharacterized protein n=1 Tax=Leptosia nina TaxID=320188 RepID=A0AAV1JZ01_9NEOP
MSTDVDDFRSILPSIPVAQGNSGGKGSNDLVSSYLHFVQHGNNFFFKPNFDLGPKIEKDSSRDTDEVGDRRFPNNLIPPPASIASLEANMEEEAIIPEAPVLSPLKMPKLPVVKQPQQLQIIPLPTANRAAANTNDQQVILGHTEALESVKGSLKVQEIMPILFELFRSYLPSNEPKAAPQTQFNNQVSGGQQQVNGYSIPQTLNTNIQQRSSAIIKPQARKRVRLERTGLRKSSQRTSIEANIAEPEVQYVVQSPVQQENVNVEQGEMSLSDTMMREPNGDYVPYL